MTGLSDYGFRDYAPTLVCEFCEAKSREEKRSFSTFTTVDPIRDGSNWYDIWAASFAKQNLVEKNEVFRPDPVNYVDAWGLECPKQNDKEAANKGYADPDHMLLVKERNALESMKNLYDKAVEANKGFEANYSACDVYGEPVITSYGAEIPDWLPPNSTYSGPSAGTPNYIDHYTDKGMLQPNMGRGLYLVFMDTDDEDAQYHGHPHTLVAFQDFEGTIYTSEYSITNIDKTTNEITRGVINGVYSSQEEFENDYDYNLFYYLEVANPSNYE